MEKISTSQGRLCYETQTWKVNELEFIYSVFIQSKLGHCRSNPSIVRSVANVSEFCCRRRRSLYYCQFRDTRECQGVFSCRRRSSATVLLASPYCAVRSVWVRRILLNANESSSTLCTNELSYVQYIHIDVHTTSTDVCLSRNVNREWKSEWWFRILYRANSLFTLAMTRVRREVGTVVFLTIELIAISNISVSRRAPCSLSSPLFFSSLRTLRLIVSQAH